MTQHTSCITCADKTATYPFPSSLNDQNVRPNPALCLDCWLIVAKKKLSAAVDEFTHQSTQCCFASVVGGDDEATEMLIQLFEDFGKSFEQTFKALEKATVLFEQETGKSDAQVSG